MKKSAEHEPEQKPVPETVPAADTARPAENAGDISGGSNPAEAAKPASDAEKTEKKAESPKPDPAVRIAELEKLNAELQDQYLRKAADFDNYRKRMIKEKQEAIDFANTRLLVDLVQILDDFDRGIAAGGVHEEGSPVAAFADGITMIRNQMGSMLEKN